MKLVVVTRFSTRIGSRPAPGEDWIRERLSLLRSITEPSLLHPAARDVSWVLEVDPATAALSRELLEPIRSAGGRPTIVEVDEEGHPTGSAPPEIGDGPLVTVRLDSDDALLPHSFERLRAAARGARDGCVLNLYAGVQHHLGTGHLRLVTFLPGRQGPFLGLVHHDPADVLETGGDHRRAREGREVRHVDGVNWVQTVHGRNLANEPAPRLRVANVRRALAPSPSLRYRAALLTAGAPVPAGLARRWGYAPRP